MGVIPKDGGPAFPVPMVPCDNAGGFTEVRIPGISVRDYYAAAIAQGLVQNFTIGMNRQDDAKFSKRVFELTDEILNERTVDNG